MYVKLTSISKMGNDQSLSPSDRTVHYTTLLPCLKTNHWQKWFYMSCLCSLLRSEKRAGSLKEENTNLRKAEANYKDLEEQCAKLKRRNAELASAVKVSNTRYIKSRIESTKYDVPYIQ